MSGNDAAPGFPIDEAFVQAAAEMFSGNHVQQQNQNQC